MKATFKVGDSVRFVYLDGRLSDQSFAIHQMFGDETSNRNVSFLIPGDEIMYHTDLIRHDGDTSPVVVPDGGEWFIARGNNMGWGRAQTEKQAIANMKRQGGAVTAYTVYRVNKWTMVDGMGSLTWPIGSPQPVEMKSVDNRKKKARA